MVKAVDTREREKEILNLVVETYIKESKPISSTHLCERCNLPYSSATVRNTMESLEKKGLLSHIHTSSGRVPTREGFKEYVGNLKEEEMVNQYPVSLDFYDSASHGIEWVANHALDILAQSSGYTSFMAISGRDEKLFFRGARFILEQPEFEDIHRVKNLFYTLEVKLYQLQELMFHCFNENVKILIGDEIGFDEIAECSLVVSGAHEKNLSFALALLGPMRMDYIKAASCLCSTKNQLREVITEECL
ncbi:MAG: hypothetical protein Q8O30_03755 [Candidatus Omnitrophota bacterium]|nr:hypothetical protein [Candidatus Omnitrophota bacterium]